METLTEEIIGGILKETGLPLHFRAVGTPYTSNKGSHPTDTKFEIYFDVPDFNYPRIHLMMEIYPAENEWKIYNRESNDHYTIPIHHPLSVDFIKMDLEVTYWLTKPKRSIFREMLILTKIFRVIARYTIHESKNLFTIPITFYRLLTEPDSNDR